jgi:hypothetical protein
MNLMAGIMSRTHEANALGEYSQSRERNTRVSFTEPMSLAAAQI